MAFVERLRRDFARMIDSHQAGRMRFLSRIQVRFLDQSSRIFASRTPGGRRDGAQGIAGTGQQTVDRGEFTFCHNWSIANRSPQTVYSAAFLLPGPIFSRSEQA